MRRFYLHVRRGIYYAEIVDPATRKRLTARSTGKTDRDEAAAVVLDWFRNGLPSKDGARRPISTAFAVSQTLDTLRTAPLDRETVEKIVTILRDRGTLASVAIEGAPSAVLFSDFLINFWTYERSSYVKDLHSVGRRMGRTHCGESLGRVKKYWEPFFKGRYLAEISARDLKAFRLHLADPTLKLSELTRNRILTVGVTALRWAARNDIIEADPTVGLIPYAAKPKKRGVLSPEEAAALFRIEWEDERVKTANILAATTGLRVGEVLALRREDITERWLWVRHSFSLKDGLKGTKTGTERRVPLLPEVRARLLELAENIPRDGFLFAGRDARTPMLANDILRGLHDALVRLSLAGGYERASRKEKLDALESWKARRITFHSWRHYFAARMADRLEARTVMLATGHSSESVFRGYADHAREVDFLRVENAAREAFGAILPFKTRALG